MGTLKKKCSILMMGLLAVMLMVMFAGQGGVGSR